MGRPSASTLAVGDPLPAEAGDVRLYRLCVSGRNALTICAKPEEQK
jgi:hypothetical protein